MHSGMTEEELINLATKEWPVRGCMEPAMYGFGREFRSLGFYPSWLPFFFVSQHGVSMWEQPQNHDLNSPYPVMIVFNNRMQEAWKKQSSKPCFVLMNPYVSYRRRNKISQANTAAGTISFFTHSTDEIDMDLDIDDYIGVLKSLPAKYQPVDICFHYVDILKGYHRPFLEQGFRCFTAGHWSNPDFMKNFYEILRQYRYSTSSLIGSHTFYSIEMGIPFFLTGEPPRYFNRSDTSMPSGDVTGFFLDIVSKWTVLDSAGEDVISPEASALVEAELGVGHGIGCFTLSTLMYSSAFWWLGKRILKALFKGMLTCIEQVRWLPNRIRFSEENRIFTHMTEEEKYSLYGLIQKYFRNETIVAVEIGSYLGASSVFIARSLTIDSELHCIDTWGNDFMSYGSSDIDSHRRDTYSEFRTNTSRYRDRIIEHRQWSYDAIEQVRRQVKYIDFLFIDGDHNYDGVKKDWELYSPLLRSGSIVVFHDTGWADGVNRVIREDVEPVAKRILFLPNMQAFRIEPRW